MYRHYLDTHSAVNPLTCPQEAFYGVLLQSGTYEEGYPDICTTACMRP